MDKVHIVFQVFFRDGESHKRVIVSVFEKIEDAALFVCEKNSFLEKDKGSLKNQWFSFQTFTIS